ncbi:MAG: ParB N-terminal domain-containing protein [Phycisphaerales bacterium]|nr:ParB N-terminal domain-containing protein [Phycisphaerales bacterium]
MLVELRSPSSIKPYDQNPRRNDGAVEAVANSIREFGWRVPVVVDEAGVVLAGHTRLRAAERLGLTEIPVHVAVGLTPAQARAFRVADNATASIATWDEDLLGKELAELKGLDVDLSVLGFSESELEAFMSPPLPEGLADADTVPEPPKQPVTQPGDLWIMGGHRLLCADSTNIDDVTRLMNGKKAALCASDPPYLVDYTGERPNDSGKDWTNTYREIDITDADRFFTAVFKNIMEVIAPHTAIYCWHAHKRQRLIAEVWERLGILDHQQVVWVKPTPVFGRVYWHFRHEPCLFGWVKGSQPPHDSNHEFNSVWEIDWEGKSRVVGNEHPTQKPVEIFARPIRKHTKPGDICFEPFSGSGSQLIAAEQTGRRCYAIELEPVFVDVAVKRWEQFTGKKAERQAASGA